MKRVATGSVMVFLLSGAWSPAADGTAARLNQEANELYAEGRTEDALERYAEALARDPDSSPLTYNLGNALYRLGRLEEALNAYGAVAEQARPDTELGQAARFNEGTASLQAGDFAAAVRSLRQAVGANPTDADFRHNLELALIRMKQQEQQKKGGDPGQEESGSEDQEENAGAEEAPGEDQARGAQDRQQQQESDPAEAPPPQPRGEEEDTAPEPPADSQPDLVDEQQDLSEEEARRLLASLARDERQDLKESLEKPQPRARRGGRDW